jgi:hypothetical protein
MLAKQKSMITAVMAAGVLAGASTATQTSQLPSIPARPAAHRARVSQPVLAAVVTPNRLFAAGGAPQIELLAPGEASVRAAPVRPPPFCLYQPAAQ